MQVADAGTCVLSPGLLARENATILNASILSFVHMMQGFERAMEKLDPKCPLYITQNDGTLMDAATAALTPVKTFASVQQQLDERGVPSRSGLKQ